MNPLVYLVPGGLGLLVLVWAIACYNRLVRLRNHVRESWADVDTELQRRWELVPRLVEVVKAYASHESDTLGQLTTLREQAAAADRDGREASEAALSEGLSQLAVRVEAYPELKADEQYLALQGQLVETEDRLQAARRFYNANVRDLNTRVEQIPSAFIARVGGFAAEAYFQTDEVARAAPKI